jgi:hypothetical protein
MAMQEKKKRNFDPLANARMDRGSTPAQPNRSPYADAVSIKDIARGTGRALDMATFGGMSALGRGMAAIPKAIAQPFAQGMQRRRDNRAAFDAKLSQERARKAAGMVGVVQPVERPAGTPGQLRGLAGVQADGQASGVGRAGVPVRGNPLQTVRQREPSPLARAATGARQPPQSQAWTARGADGRQVPMSPAGAGSTAAAVPLPASYMAPSDRAAKGLMQTTLGGGAYRYTPSAEEQATLGKASYSDNLQGAAPMASGAQVRAWEQPGALADAPMRGGFVGSNGLTDEDRAANLAYWQNVREGVTQDIQRRALTKAAFNPGMDRVDREGNIDTSVRQGAMTGLGALAGGADAEKAGAGRTAETWQQRGLRELGLEMAKGGNALELEQERTRGLAALEAMKQSGEQGKALREAVDTFLPKREEGAAGLGGVGGYSDGQRAWGLTQLTKLRAVFGDAPVEGLLGGVAQAAQAVMDPAQALQAAQTQLKRKSTEDPAVQELAKTLQAQSEAAAQAELERLLFGEGRKSGSSARP